MGRSRHRLRSLAPREAIAGLLAAVALTGVGCGSGHKAGTNGLIAANWQGEGIFLVDPVSTARRSIPQTESAGALAWSPDGRTIAFELPGKVLGVDVYTIRSDGTGLRVVAKNAYGPSWSPDGRRLLIARDTCTPYFGDCIDPDFRVDLDSIRSDGRGLRHVARVSNGVSSPVWSPDGKRIAYIARNGGLYLIDARGGHRRRLPGRFGSRLSWSPDGSALAFEIQADAPNWADIGVVDVTTGKRENLTHRPGQDWGPAWSPDGREIVFVEDRNCVWTGKCELELGAEGPRELWLMDADGKHLHQLTRNGGLGYGDPAWQPVRGSQ